MKVQVPLARVAGLLLVACLSLPAVAQVQGPKRVAYLSTLADAPASERIAAVGKSIDKAWPVAGRGPIEYRTYRYVLPSTTKASNAESEAQRLKRNEEIEATNRAKIADMLAWKPDVVLAPGALPAKAAAQANSSVPIVFACKCNPLPDGWNLIANPAKPERNLTGFTRYHFGDLSDDPGKRRNLQSKRIELIKQASSRPVKRVAALYGDDFDFAKWKYEELARSLGIEWVPIRLTEAGIDEIPALLRTNKVDGALVLADTFLDKFTGRLVKATAGSPIPVMFPWDEADQGAWMHYGTVMSIPDKAAEYIVNILRGRAVRDYPVEFPKQMELAVNFKTAKAQGWEFPKEFLLLVDRAIE